MKRFIKKYILEILFISSFMIIGFVWSVNAQSQFLNHTFVDTPIAYNTFDTAQLLPKQSDYNIQITIHYLKG